VVNALMLFKGDGTVVSVAHCGPLELRKNRPGQANAFPLRRYAVAARTYSSKRFPIEHLQEVFRRRLKQLPTANEIKRLVGNCGFPSHLSRASLEREHGVHDILPRPLCHDGIAVLQTGLSDLEVDGGLAQRLVLRINDLTGCFLVGSIQAGAFASLTINAIIDAPTSAPTD
jgi:hypothetical protein